MQPAVPERNETARWHIALPSRPSRLTGVSMAGFRDRTPAEPIDLRPLPHPAITLVIEFGDGPLVVDDAVGRQHGDSLVAGPEPGDIRVRGKDTQCVQVRLSPMVASAVLGSSPPELHGSVVALEQFWGRDAVRLRARLRDAASWEDRFALTDAALVERHGTGPSVDPETLRAWELIALSQGRVRIADLASDTGWSRKRLWSRFRAQIGMSPKRAARLVRFDHAAHRLAAGVSPALVAATGGFVDQSHLHRDVMVFTGTTPRAVADAPWLAVDDVAWPGR